jgi:hypothetical protein
MSGTDVVRTKPSLFEKGHAKMGGRQKGSCAGRGEKDGSGPMRPCILLWRRHRRLYDQTELIARIHAIVRRSQGHAQSIVQTDDLIVNVDAKTVVRRDDHEHRLPRADYQRLSLV